jgi:hypothetical protein
MPDIAVVALVAAAGAIGYAVRPLVEWITNRRLVARERDEDHVRLQTQTILSLRDAITTVVLEVPEATGDGEATSHTWTAQTGLLRVGSLAAGVEDAELRRRIALFQGAVTAVLDGNFPGTWAEKQARLRDSIDEANAQVSVVERSLESKRQKPPEDSVGQAARTRVAEWCLTHPGLRGFVLLHEPNERSWRLYWSDSPMAPKVASWMMPESEARKFVSEGRLRDIDQQD